jgi:glutathione S-transferase
MITVYHLGVSQSDRIIWLMEELNLPYQLKWFDRGEDGLAPDEYRALHPAGTAPIIRDGELILAESAAIAEYISQRYGNGALSVAVDSPDYADYLYWMQFNSNVQSIFFGKMALSGLPESAQASKNVMTTIMQRREHAYYQYLNDRLASSQFLAGDQLSCADILSVFNLTTLPLFGGRAIDDLRNVVAYLDRIKQRPAYIKAMVIAGPEAQRPT